MHEEGYTDQQETTEGTSMETGGIAKLYTAMSMRAAEEAIRIGVEIGTATAEKKLEEGKRKAEKGRYKRRLHNTRLLLANYRNLKDHASGAVFSGKKAKENALDVLDGLDRFEYEDKYYIEAIKQSQQRTMIILTHIDEMMNLYRIACEQSDKPEAMRRYRVLYATYCDPERPTVTEIVSVNGIEERTYYRDIGLAIKPLTALIFGIDGLRID